MTKTVCFQIRQTVYKECYSNFQNYDINRWMNLGPFKSLQLHFQEPTSKNEHFYKNPVFQNGYSERNDKN